ncbi:sensor histidine kinase [Pararhodonellum marinum]|uniref:sensor histidine kinase n=1 Tax=Pararhodonellum marinum TaxID=2755358 RepID=UPI00188EB21E|nr:histidine kinase [Pararhodonellum marinum]
MKSRALQFREIEWWLLTILFLAIILSNFLQGGNVSHFHNDDYIRTVRYFANIFIPIILFLAFSLVHIKLIPNYLKDKKKAKFIIYSLLVFFASMGLTLAFAFNAEYTQDAWMPFYFNTIAVYVGYLVAVKILQELVHPPRLQDYLIYNILRLLAIYIFTLIFLFQLQFVVLPDPVLVTYAIILPAFILVVVYNFFLIYQYRKANRTSEANAYYILLLAGVLGLTLFVAINSHSFVPVYFGVGMVLLIMVIIIPLSNLFFKKYEAILGEINTLSYQVDQGQANLDFLRSQINPHFLFNSLNTLYGTALQESAERTAEGVQKLGDMMRFMLHENHRDRIPVEREKEYLQHYVDLQLLRLKDQEKVEIVFKTKEEPCSGELAPMLLIPFVENAFKHGISLQNKSWVKINLTCSEQKVDLDVHNSIHPKQAQDPEMEASGVGLANVRKRLELLYAEQHELVIRENDMEFFVHLTLYFKPRKNA